MDNCTRLFYYYYYDIPIHRYKDNKETIIYTISKNLNTRIVFATPVSRGILFPSEVKSLLFIKSCIRYEEEEDIVSPFLKSYSFNNKLRKYPRYFRY